MNRYQEIIEENKKAMIDCDDKTRGELFRANNRLTNRIKFLSSKKGDLDIVASRELGMYTANESDLYYSSRKHIEKALCKKFKAGEFDLLKAVIAYKGLIDAGAQKYVKDFCSKGDSYNSVFDSVTRWDAAYTLAENIHAELKLGNTYE